MPPLGGAARARPRGVPSADEDTAARDAAQARVAHLLEHGPRRLLGRRGRRAGRSACALALVREGLWGLSLFGVRPTCQGQGIGGAAAARARWRYGASGPRGAIILARIAPARDAPLRPRRASRLRPCVAAGGASSTAAARSRRAALPRPGDLGRPTPGDHRRGASRHVRGAAHGRDLPAMLADAGAPARRSTDAGFAVARDGSPVLLAARDDERRARPPVVVLSPRPRRRRDACTSTSSPPENDWAIDVAACDAGLALTPDGPVFVRGDVGPLAPYLPSGAYL